MCRFVAYVGKEPVLLHNILGKHENSLIKQSRASVEGLTGVNGDGFGIGWYDREIQENPAIFKSIQPAWNDQNLKYMTSVVKSRCFLGHVRASTVGEVAFNNCHPFHFENYLFVHNGTIDAFDRIKRSLVQDLSDKVYNSIKGHTDSEHFFALVMEKLLSQPHQNHAEGMLQAVKDAIETLQRLQEKAIGRISYKINIALTNGECLLVLRTSTPNVSKPLSLYLHKNEDDAAHKNNMNGSPYFLICSEKLWGNQSKDDSWQEIPPEHFFLIDKNLKGRLLPF